VLQYNVLEYCQSSETAKKLKRNAHTTAKTKTKADTTAKNLSQQSTAYFEGGLPFLWRI